MFNSTKKAFEEIEKLPENGQKELAQIIQDELSRENTFLRNQKSLSQMAKEALYQYKAGKTSNKAW
jgi:hypothetical protein